ncbi:YaaC family protein [Agrobacterium radiobacter]|uniref:YaaC family protein n=1 Tax=Agrobacterium radiobacter TaxID=362 RepID=UPI003C2B4BDA
MAGLAEIAEDRLTIVEAENQPIFRTDVDYDLLAEQRVEAVQKWQKMPADDKKKFCDQRDFEKQEGVVDLKSPELIPAKNLSLIRKEVKSRVESSNVLQLLPVDSLDFDDSLLELAESIENVADIRSIYKLRKLTTGKNENAGINTEEAARLKNCFSQGRELFLAGKQGSLMVKPLNFFYAVTAYTYGAIVLNNPLRYRKDMLPGSHGMSYLPDVVQAQFGGDSPRGTFSDLVTAFPTHLVKSQGFELNIDCTSSLLEFYKRRCNVSLGTLLSLVPEMTDYYKLTTGRDSRCHPLEIVNSNDLRSVTWEFHIGDGERRPTLDGIENCFSGFPRSERHGKIVITVPASQAHAIRACIYTDIRGKHWYVDNPFYPIILPEIAVHFLITSTYSNIMRYRPDEWGSVLLNEVSSDISLLTRHYFSSFQRKFFIVILRSISKYLPYAA